MGRKSNEIWAGLLSGLMGGAAQSLRAKKAEDRYRADREARKREKQEEDQAKADAEMAERRKSPFLSTAKTAEERGVAEDLINTLHQLRPDIPAAPLGDLLRGDTSKGGLYQQQGAAPPATLGGRYDLFSQKYEDIRKSLESAQQEADVAANELSAFRAETDRGPIQINIDSLMGGGDTAESIGQKYGMKPETVESLKSKLEKRSEARRRSQAAQKDYEKSTTQKQLLERAIREIGPDTGLPPQMQQLLQQQQMQQEAGAQAQARAQLNGTPMDHMNAGAFAQHYLAAMDRNLPPEQQAQSWMWLYQNAGIPLPMFLRQYLFNVGGDPEQTMNPQPRLPGGLA